MLLLLGLLYDTIQRLQCTRKLAVVEVVIVVTNKQIKTQIQKHELNRIKSEVFLNRTTLTPGARLLQSLPIHCVAIAVRQMPLT